jgi:hypothetical protein
MGRTISDEGVRAKLAGTPLESWAGTFLTLSRQYGIDPNWIVSYLQWETGFGGTVGDLHPSMLFNDPWDMLCGVPGEPCGSGSRWGSVECRRAPNDYCYYVYPSMEAGIEAGYRNWQSYIQRGWTNYFSSLSVALCGNPAGCDSQWVPNVIAQADSNAARWPYTGGGGGVIIFPPKSVGVALVGLVGAALLGGGAYVAVKGLPR